MRIAVIGSKGLPPKQGGIEHHCAELYPRIVARGHSVDLYARSSYNDLPWNHHYDHDGVRVITLPSLNFRGIDAFFNSAFAAFAACSKRYDIIHFHALGPSLFTWVPHLMSPTAKVVVTCHGLDWQRAKWGNVSSRLIRTGEQMAVRFADEIVVVSEELQRYFYETHRRKTTYIGNAPAEYVHTDSGFSFGKSLGLNPTQYVLFVGRLVPEKNPDLLIQAFQHCRPAHWKLVLVGGNSDTSSFVSMLHELSWNDPDIIFAGELRGRRLAEIVRGAGLFVLPSGVEGLPLALLEAMREGVPVLGSDIPVHRQLIGVDRGLLFQTGNLADCTAALDWAIQHPDVMTAMAQQAQHYIQTHHSWDQIVDHWLHLYDHLLHLSQPIETSQFS